jgi:hypothetical protein
VGNFKILLRVSGCWVTEYSYIGDEFDFLIFFPFHVVCLLWANNFMVFSQTSVVE